MLQMKIWPDELRHPDPAARHSPGLLGRPPEAEGQLELFGNITQH